MSRLKQILSGHLLENGLRNLDHWELTSIFENNHLPNLVKVLNLDKVNSEKVSRGRQRFEVEFELHSNFFFSFIHIEFKIKINNLLH